MTRLDTLHVGQAICAARKAQGLWQDQLTDPAGVGVRFIVDLEGAKPSTQLGKALPVAATLGSSVTVGDIRS